MSKARNIAMGQYTSAVRRAVLVLACSLSLPLASRAQVPPAEGREALERGDYARAESIYREFLAQHPNSAEGLSNLGAALARREQFPEAIASYEKALRINPALVRIYFNLAVAYLRSGDYGKAVPALEKFLKASPGEMRARELLGVCLVETGDLRRGIGELEKALAAKPGDASLMFVLAEAHLRAGDQQRGQQLLAELEKRSGRAADVHMLQGLLFYRAKRYEEAEPEFQKALEIDPQSAPALAALGRLRLRVNDDAPAIELLQKALKLAPQDAESSYQLGVLLDRNGQTARGREHLNRAIALRANYPDPMYALAKIEFREDNPKAALSLLERAVQYAPEQDAIHLLLARTYQALGRQDKAKLEFAEVRRLQRARIEGSLIQGQEPDLPLEPEAAQPPPPR